MGVPEKSDARYTNGEGDDTKVTFISGNQKYTTDQEKGNLQEEAEVSIVSLKRPLRPLNYCGKQQHSSLFLLPGHSAQ